MAGYHDPRKTNIGDTVKHKQQTIYYYNKSHRRERPLANREKNIRFLGTICVWMTRDEPETVLQQQQPPPPPPSPPPRNKAQYAIDD